MANNKNTEPAVQKTINFLLYVLIKLLSKLPFFILYRFSDLLFLFIFYIIRYRKKVVAENLHFAFPEKTPKELTRISKAFYHHFCDLIFEIVRYHSMKDTEIVKRVVFKGLELTEPCFNEKRNIIVLALHHNNWEWGSVVHLKSNYIGVMVYDPIRNNHLLEKFLVRSRTRWGGICVPVHKTAREIFRLNQMGKPIALWLGADQTAPASSKLWAMFLNREAPFFSGPEKIAVKSNNPVFFHDIRKIKRGHYEIRYVPLFMNPKDIDPNEIILEYIRQMEKSIREQPEYYLWSHRRWKHKRPQDTPIIGK
jgi:KDO2-lipid IV(A) lauroyltransferase